jgi:hypothetical protein
VMTMSRRRPPVAARLIAVPSVGVLVTGATPTPGSQPWLVVGLALFGAAAVALLAAVGVKMRRTPGPPSERPDDARPAGEAGGSGEGRERPEVDGDTGGGDDADRRDGDRPRDPDGA